MADPAEVLSHLDELLTRRAFQLRIEDDPAEEPDVSRLDRVEALAAAALDLSHMGTDAAVGGPAGAPKAAILRGLRFVIDKQVAYNQAMVEGLRTLNEAVHQLVRLHHQLLRSNLALRASVEGSLDLANAEIEALRGEVEALRAARP